MINSAELIKNPEDLKPVCRYNDTTALCIYERRLYVVKKVDRACKPAYEAMQTLCNPHLARIVAIFDKTDCIEVVRQYISGDPLSELIDGEKCLSPDAAVKITAGICEGLSDIHRLGYVHRDINPNNIIVTADGSAVIIDFGIMRSFSQDKSADTRILGTPGYAAPEQFGFSQSDSRTDIYAVGVLLNVMLTGEMPSGKTAPGALGRIISKCTEIDSQQRYRDIESLKKALSDRLPGDSPIDRALTQIPGLRSKNTLVVVLAAIGYLFALLLTAGMFATAEKGTYFQTAIAWVLCLPIPFFCFHNFLGIWDRIPLSRGASKRSQRIVYTVLGVASLLIGLIIFGEIPHNPV